MSNTFRVITTVPCVKCDATKRRMKRHGIPFETIAAEDAADLVDEAKESGATSFPIVLAPDGSWWSDYRVDKIDDWGTATYTDENGAEHFIWE